MTGSRVPDSAGADPSRAAAHGAVWSRHWATGAPHSCAGSFGATYEGEIAAFWARVLGETAEEARILDLATGNGALPRLFLALKPSLRGSIVGVDMAAPSNTWAAGLPPPDPQLRVELIGGTDLCALPLPDGSVDLVTSQYGIEYAPQPDATREALRVRAPAGRFAAVVHHAGSRPVQLAAIELSHLDWLTGPDGLLQATRDMIEPVARSASPTGRASLANDASANAARQRFNAAQDVIEARANDRDGADVLWEVQDAASAVLGTAVQSGATRALAAWDALAARLSDLRFRLDELRRCAMDEAAIRALVDTLERVGLRVELGTVQERGFLFGWTVIGRPVG